MAERTQLPLGGELGEGSRLVREHYFDTKAAAVIAKEQGKKESAVRMTLLRIREALRRCVQRELEAQGSQA